MTAGAATAPPAAQRTPGRWLVLYTCTLIAVTVVNDQAMIGLISPAIKRDLGASQGTLDLLASVTMLVVAALILPASTLGDRYGRRRLMLVAAAGLCLTSVLETAAPGAGLLVGLRALAGVCQAFLYPLSLATITVTFDAEERPRAISLYAAALGISAAAGTVLVQVLNQEVSWRAAFALSALLSLAAVLMLLRFVPESKTPNPRPFDLPGVLLCAAGLFALVFGVNEAAGAGSFARARVLVPAGLGIALLGGFAWWESRARAPALPLSLFRSPRFSIGILLGVFLAFAQTGVFYHTSLYLQVLERYTPLEAAVRLLPLGLSVFIFAMLAGRLEARRVEPRTLMAGGMLAAAVAIAALWFVLKPDLVYGFLVLPLIVMGLGFGFVNAPRTNAVVSAAPLSLSGPASAANLAFFQLGSALGVAGMGALLATFGVRAYDSRLRDTGLSQAQIQESTALLRDIVRENAGTVASQFGIPVRTLTELVGAYADAYATGLGAVMLVTAAVLLAGAALAWLGFRPAPASATQPTLPVAPRPAAGSGE